MTYLKLLELIEAMSDDQKKMDVVIAVGGENHTPGMMTEIAYTDDEEEDALPVGQPILV